MSIAENSEYYRQRADKLRQAATAPLSAEDRDTLVFFAEQFDELADAAEVAARTRPPDK
jgi:hypothetical protein